MRPQQPARGCYKKGTIAEVVRLGEVVEGLVEGRASAQYRRYGRAVETWQLLLPELLVQRCRLKGISAGSLEVVAESPVYASELRTCSRHLLSELQKRCPEAGISRIKVVVG